MNLRLTFPEYLRTSRERSEVSMPVIARRFVCEDGTVGCSTRNLYQYETGARATVTRSSVERLADAYGLPREEALLMAGFSPDSKLVDVPDQVKSWLAALSEADRNLIFLYIESVWACRQEEKRHAHRAQRRQAEGALPLPPKIRRTLDPSIATTNGVYTREVAAV